MFPEFWLATDTQIIVHFDSMLIHNKACHYFILKLVYNALPKKSVLFVAFIILAEL